MADIATQELHPRRPLLATHHWPLATNDRPLAAAFTLIEMLVVLGIIGLVVTLGVPLFGVLTGSKSQESAQNVVAAAIGQARTIAVNEGKHAGVLFYMDPATERTAMSLVIVQDPASGLEDADPYDKYKTFVSGQRYYAAEVDANGVVTRNDRVIQLTSDADTTFVYRQYNQASPQPQYASEYHKYFGNYRPVVRTFRCTKQNDGSGATRPPQNGPYTPLAPLYQAQFTTRSGQAPGSAESSRGQYANEYWNTSADKEVTSYSVGAQQLLPNGVGVQVIVTPITSDVVNVPERYLRTACIMFDPQGRLVLRSFSLSDQSTLGKYLALYARLDQNGRPLNPRAENIVSGIGAVFYDRQLFRSQEFSEADFTYRDTDTNENAIRSTYTSIFGDYPSPNGPDVDADFNQGKPSEQAEETWLDNNTIPLLINRFSGSMTQAE